jgi:hypothetical protein
MERTSRKRAARVTASGFAIAWSIALFIFFNFYEHHIALHHDGILEPLITGEFSQWLWILNTTLILSVIGHTIVLIFDRYVLRESTLIILNIFGIATVATLLGLFPFDFSVIDNANAAKWADRGVTIALIVTLVGISIGTLVSVIRLTIKTTSGTKDY